MTDEIKPDQLRVTVEAGPDYRPTERVSAALDELADALRAAGEPEVAGFSLGREGSIECTYFRQRDWATDHSMVLFEARPAGMTMLCNNEVVDEWSI